MIEGLAVTCASDVFASCGPAGQDFAIYKPKAIEYTDGGRRTARNQEA